MLTVNSTFTTMKKIILLIAVIAALASCSKNDNVLSEKKMAHIIRDIHLSDGVLNTRRFTEIKSENVDSLYVYKQVFEKNKVTREEFVASMQHYSKYPRLLDEIYTMVVNDLSAQQEALRSEIEKAEKADKSKKGKKKIAPLTIEQKLEKTLERKPIR